MLLEINPLVLPDIGLVFWNTIAFFCFINCIGQVCLEANFKSNS